MPKVKVYALKDGLRFEGAPYLKGNPIELPEYMLKEWLALGLVSREPPAPPAKVEMRGAMHKDEEKSKAAQKAKTFKGSVKPNLVGGVETEMEP